MAEAYYQEIDQFTDADFFVRGLEFPSSFLDKLDLSADGYDHDFSSDSEFEVYRDDITGEIAGWVEDDLLPYVRELYRKKYPDRKASDAEQILAIDGFGPKEVCSVLLDQAERVAVKNRPLDFGGIAWELIELPKTALDEMFRSVTFGTPGSQEQTFEISDFGDWIRGRGSVEEELERLVKEHFIPKMEQWYYEAHQGAHPDWEPEEPQQSDIALAFTSVKASNGTELHFQVLVGDSGEETDMCSPYDIEAGNGCDLSDYVDVPW